MILFMVENEKDIPLFNLCNDWHTYFDNDNHVCDLLL
jgi:hypothetical protein